ncbi:MAG: hypothetical protein R3E87_01220 [Burkholderiaceae bacterium]
MPGQPPDVLKALTDSLAEAIDDLHRAEPDAIVARAEDIRARLHALARNSSGIHLDPLQLERVSAQLDRYQRVLNRRLNQTGAGLRILGRDQHVYELPGR